MQAESNLNGIRRAVLDRAEKSERAHKLWILAAAAVEAACLLGFVLLADFRDRLHVLLLITAMLTYGTLAMGLLALGAFTQAWCRRLLKAIELLDEHRGNPTGGEV